MVCQEVQNNLSAYLDEELSVEMSWAISQHLAVCPACQWEKERIARTSELIQTMEIPLLKRDIWEGVLAQVTPPGQIASTQVFTKLFSFLSLCAIGAITLLVISTLGQAVLSLWRALGRNLVNLFSLLPKLVSTGQIGVPSWSLTSGLLLAFLISLWLFRKVLTNASLGGPLHE